MMNQRNVRTPLSAQQLNDRIRSLIQSTSFEIRHLSIDDRHFGNVSLELSDSIRDFRFIQDRGDIYVSKKTASAIQWSDHLFVSHEKAGEQYYGSLLKAVALVVNG